MNARNLSATFCFPTDIAILINRLIFYFLIQGKFVWIHFGSTGKLAGANAESCKHIILYINFALGFFLC